MTLEQEVAQLASALKSDRVVERRSGVQQAARLLADARCTGAQRETIVGLLRDLLAVETYTTVRDDAEAILANVWEGVEPTASTGDRQHMIGVRCTKGHVSYYDRRKVCSGENLIMRVYERDGDRDVEMFYVACRTPGCGEQVKLPIDCGEYGQ